MIKIFGVGGRSAGDAKKTGPKKKPGEIRIQKGIFFFFKRQGKRKKKEKKKI